MESRWWLVGAALAAVALGGCAGLRSSGIDPSGEHVFAQSPFQSSSGPYYREYPGGSLAWDNTQVIVTPARTVAPVGSDVVLLAGVRGPDAFLRTNERVEWVMSPGGVGQLVDYGRGTWTDLAFGDFNWPRKVSPTWAITSTSRRYLRLNQETPTPTDDVLVLRGQTWVTVNSPVEGTSYVTAFAPSVYGWNERKQTAVIHWIDAEFVYPPAAINPAGGRHVFTTTVTRHTDHAPCEGWIVRYQIRGGPPAGFAPQGTQMVEVPTNEAGQASAEIAQAQAAPGVNPIRIQVIRPAGAWAGGTRLAVSCGSTTATWSAAQLAIRKSGPAAAGVGAELTYRIDVTNPGDLPADDVRVTDEIPAGLEYISSEPQAQQSGAGLVWQLGRLEARQTRSFQVRVRAGQSGTITSCAEATAGGGGLQTRDCITTTIGAPAVKIDLLGPSKVGLGEEVNFEILVTNQGQVPATGLLIEDRFDEGLVHSEAPSPIKKDLADLAPGQTHRIGVTFRTTRIGSLCHEVEVTGAAGIQVTGRRCVEVVAGAAPSSGPAPGPGLVAPPPIPPATSPDVTVKKSGPASSEVGKDALFDIQVRNTGNATLTNVRVVDTYDAELKPVEATGGHRRIGNSLEWTIASLAPGAFEEFQVLCRCQAPSARTCNRVTATSTEGVRHEGEACLSIAAAAPGPAPGGATGPGTGSEPAAPAGAELSLRMMALHNPVRVDTPLTYEVFVENPSTTASAHDVVLVVTLPPEMKPLSIGTIGPARHAIAGQTVRFEPVAEIRPGETPPLLYRIHVNTLRAGNVVVQAELTSRESPQPITRTEETEIIAQ
ncbi:MAG: DUF11 domain-containing protein [Pirellulales bacterium]|nr:DUF11 domain-containing protein [Pirellulales bacterium]